jgi:hypothetical protein
MDGGAEVTMLRPMAVAVVAASLVVAACDLLDPSRPVQHPDTEFFGNLIELTRIEGEEVAWSVRVRVGMPRAFLKAEQAGGRPTPILEKGIVADVVVTSDTVVLADGRGALIEDINPGSEVAVLPVSGTTRMIGTSNLNVVASYFIDFESYRRWRLPGLALPEDAAEVRADPDRINSDGVERAPVPIGSGRVLYFSARLRSPARADEEWSGAPRPGLGEPGSERTFRTELAADGWTSPAPVEFDGVEGAASVTVTWVSQDETRCLVTIEDEGGSWVGAAGRAAAGDRWGSVDRVTQLGEGWKSDGVYLAASGSMIVFTASIGVGVGTDLWLYDPDAEQTPLPLQPLVNTPRSEWGPRVGPNNELFFSRDDRQFLFIEDTLHPVVVPGPHRTVVTEAAPSDDGKWLFLCIPNYRPVELDQDIYVAERLGVGRLGEPVAVDDWRP